MLFWIVLALGLLFCLVMWIAADVRFVTRAMKEIAELGGQGRLEDACAAQKRLMGTRRPFALFLQKSGLPGAADGMHAMQLHTLGRTEEALEAANRAVERARERPDILAAALAARIQVLTAMGRYEEARQDGFLLKTLPGAPPRLLTVTAILELYLGRLEEARAIAAGILSADPREDGSRNVLSSVHSLQGEMREAIDALMYAPSEISKFYDPRRLARMKSDAESAALVGAQDRELSGVVTPGRYLGAASAYLEGEDIEGAEFSLGCAEKVLGNHPVILLVYERFRARAWAARGREAEAERHLASARELQRRLSSRQQGWETRMAEGRCRLSLGRPEEAARILGDVLDAALHPLEKHASRYWKARACEAAGRGPEALREYKAVVADGIPSWMRTRAAESAARLEA